MHAHIDKQCHFDISNHKSMSDVQIAKIHSAIINFDVYLIRLMKQEVRLRMLGP